MGSLVSKVRKDLSDPFGALKRGIGAAVNPKKALDVIQDDLAGIEEGLSPKIPEINIPTVEPPPVMPLADEESAGRSRRRALARRMAGSGRASTILSNGLGTYLGG